MLITLPALEATGLRRADFEAIQTFYRAFAEGRPELLDEALSADWQDIPLAPHQAAGRDGMKPLIEAFFAAFSDLSVTIHEIIGANGRAAVRSKIAGTHRRAWFGIEPTDKPFTMALHEFHHLENGRLTHTWHLEDWLAWLAQVGAWPLRQGGAV